MHANQLPLDDATAVRLVREQFAAAGDVPIERLNTAATTSCLFRIGDAYSARFPMQDGDAAEYWRELDAGRDAMAQFAASSTVPAPRQVLVGRPGHGYPMPWSVQTWLPGAVATPHSLEASSAFARDLARLVLALRAVDTRGRTFSGGGRGGILTDHDPWVAECLAESAGLLPVERLRALWADLRATPPADREVMSHKDLTPFNLLVADGRLVGVLDTGGFGPADAALDLVAGWHLLDGRRREEFRHALAADDDEWRRGAAWVLQQALGLVWHYRVTNPPMSALGRSTIGRLLEAPDLTG